jgi:hypothetical protein
MILYYFKGNSYLEFYYSSPLPVVELFSLEISVITKQLADLRPL